MIPNQWYVVLESRQVKAGRPLGVMRLGEKLIFWRDEAGRVVCLRDRCAHRGAALSAGKVVGGCIQCPFHGIRYDARGHGVLIPANGKAAPVPERFAIRAYPTHEAQGFIWIWWGDDPPANLPPPGWFEDLDDGLTYASVTDPWATHYSRAVENQLDPVHLPFVHANSIGRGNRTLVNGPVSQWVRDDLMYTYVYNQVDTGQTPLRPDEIPGPHGPFRLELLMPNLWQNHISEDVRIVVAFVPVDAEHTLMLLRFYQRFMQVPLLKTAITKLSAIANLYILHQDRRVVVTQRPYASALHMDEQLIQGDRPVLEYRRKRQALVAAAKSEGSHE